jgi:hypothetical protein
MQVASDASLSAAGLHPNLELETPTASAIVSLAYASR